MKPRTPGSREATLSRVVFVKSPIKLTISLLVSNRIDTIRKCLDSIKPLLDQLPSELVVVDTVGEENSDGSLAVAREYTDHIVRFHWCDDFAAARNAGLSLARGEWFLYLDDDEWFDDVTPILDFLKTDDGSYFSCLYNQRSYDDFSGAKYLESMVCRMVRRTQATRFHNKIHEFLESFSPTKHLDCFVHHYGYVYESSAERFAHSRRNIAPLLDLLEQDPKNLRNILQLCQEYYAIRDYQSVRELCERTLEFGLSTPTPFIGPMIVYYIHSLLKFSDIQAAMDVAQAFLGHPYVEELTKAVICLVLQAVDSPLVTEETALAYIDTYFASVDALDQDPDKALCQLMLSTVKDSVNDQHRQHMLQRAMQLCKALVRWDKARGYLERYCLTGEKADACLSACMEPVVAAALAAGELPALLEALSPSLQKPKLLSDFLQACETALKQHKPGDFQHRWDGIRVLAGLPLRHPRITVQKLLLAQHENRVQDMPALVEEYAALDIAAIAADDVLALCCRNQISPAPLAGKLFLEAWEATVVGMLKEFPAPERDCVLAFLQQFWPPDSPEMLFLTASIQFDALMDLIKNSPSSIEFDAAFAQYVQTNAAYYRLLSPADHFSPERCGYLGKSARAAYFLTQALAYKQEGRPELQVRAIRQALSLQENLKDLARYLAKAIEAQQTGGPLSADEEMRLLARNVKDNILALLRSGQWAQAKTLLDSLRSITPDDPELKFLCAKLPDGI